ncbi:MAG: gamma-glutamylcyclotransferase family protein [Rubripirellula sp.]
MKTTPTHHAQSPTPRSVFVYGTLKRGQCRENVWPTAPSKVTPAWIRAALYGRSDYPALRPGNDQVLGELWSFTTEKMPSIVEALDRVEGTNQIGEPDLYVRKCVPTFSIENLSLGEAYCYFYASDPRVDGFHRILPAKSSEHQGRTSAEEKTQQQPAKDDSENVPILNNFLQWPEES